MNILRAAIQQFGFTVIGVYNVNFTLLRLLNSLKRLLCGRSVQLHEVVQRGLQTFLHVENYRGLPDVLVSFRGFHWNFQQPSLSLSLLLQAPIRSTSARRTTANRIE